MDRLAPERDMERVICHCQVCKGVLKVSGRSRLRHMKERPPIEQEPNEPDTLHRGTTMTSYGVMMATINLLKRHHVTQQCITAVLRLIRDVLGDLAGNKIPLDYADLEKQIKPYLPYEELWTSCPEECDIFRGSKHQCHNIECRGKGNGRHYHYLPLIPQLKQMYSTSSVAQMLQQHGGDNQEAPSYVLQDVHRSPAWKELYGPNGDFEGEPRNISLEFSADGFQPWHHTTSDPYSMEQQASIILNLPPNIRSKAGFVILHGLVPGPSAPKEEKYNIYLRPLVMELQELARGVDCFDSFKGENFQLRATVLLHVHDFPGQAKVFQGHGSGSIQNCCFICRAEGIRSEFLNKTIYRSGREFLPPNDPLRRDTSFPGGGVEDGMPVIRNFEREREATAVHGQFAKRAKLAPNRSHEKRIAKTGMAVAAAAGARNRCSEFDRLGPLEASKVVVEGMHTIQGVAKNLHALVNGHADNKGVRLHEQSLGRFDGCYLDNRGRLKQAPFSMTAANKQKADNRLQLVTIPYGKGTLPQQAFAAFHSMKSHTWHLMLTKGVYPFVLRDTLGDSQRCAVVQLCHILGIASSKQIYVDQLSRIEVGLQRCLCIMDREFPETLKTILWHMLRHIPRFLRRYGPMNTYWMFSFERMIHHYVVKLNSRRNAEASIIKSHRIERLYTLAVAATPNVAEDGSSTSPAEQKQQWSVEEGSRYTWKGEEKYGNRGSVVYTRNRHGLFFGRIMFFFFTGGRKMASVRWFDSPEEDPQSKLLKFNATTHASPLDVHPVVKVDDLSEPLIVGNDDGDATWVFVLDFLDRIRCIELLDWIESIW